MAKSTAVLPAKTTRRCAIYTRKSREEGLEQEFNTLDAQRDAGEAYVSSQRAEGWEVSPVRYDDGGYTGANTERPALQRLIADIKRGVIDVVVVYKIDRLSRSLLDFAKLIEVFDKHHVSLVAVTQQFNTATSLGRLVLNILLSFAQFEREMIAERTRDKMRAARRRGKWIGGTVPFGYDAREKKLVINDAEAQQVRALFDMYLQEHSILRLVEFANSLGWRTKSWTTKTGNVHVGGKWTKSIMGRLLSNPVYAGRVVADGNSIAGEHPAIVEDSKFDQVAAQLKAGRNGRDWSARNLHGFLLRGLVRCAVCETAMISSTGRSRGKDYRYYTCLAVRQRGRTACSVRSVQAQALEDFVVARIRELARKPSMVTDTVAAIVAELDAQTPELDVERRYLDQERGVTVAESRALVKRLADASGAAAGAITERLGELDTRVRQIDDRMSELTVALASAQARRVTPEEVAEALTGFDEVWDALTLNEQARIVGLIVERVEFDGRAGRISITYSPTGLALLHDEVRGEAGRETAA
jgi:site-specific DNA recombinase